MAHLYAFQYLIGSLSTAFPVDLAGQVPGFQYLIGSLSTSTVLAHLALTEAQFQYLIGSLSTSSSQRPMTGY